MNLDRLKKDIIKTGSFGRNPVHYVSSYNDLKPEKGVTRPTGSFADKKTRDYTVNCMKEAGLEVKIDIAGNIFGKKSGHSDKYKSVMCGSHIDSVVNGGQFDGALGVFAAIEVVRRLNEENFKNHRPIELVVFTGEEGSSFDMTLLGSSFLIGELTLPEVLNRKNKEGKTLHQELNKIGYSGDFQRTLEDVEYFVELHIEQGPILHNKNIPIGIVENISGIVWIEVSLIGEENHAGTTPMNMRKDALVAASEIIQFINNIALKMANRRNASTMGTVGKVNVFPNNTNTIPARVNLGIDLRDINFRNLELLKNDIICFVEKIKEKYQINAEISFPPSHSPSSLNQDVLKIIEESALIHDITSIRMNSGAVHDAQNMAKIVKTGMIFVPSVKGISHSPMEWTDWQDIEKGVKVLLETIKKLSLI